MRVDIQRDLDPLVAESLLHHLRVDAVLEGDRCARVAQAVKFDRADTGFLQESRELTLTEVIDLEGISEAIRFLSYVRPFLREHEAVIPVRDAVAHLDLGLVLPVHTKKLHELRGEIESPNLAVFRWTVHCFLATRT